ncbi:hypothetical protein EZV61_18185 [Corallincola luteus]|uniref:Type II toxin-antitoxin system Phd/YefM family antitoxin n=1 Tax=Corallincola luteus TaxID=1775177 RepID=A0ABY2AFU0_9GAMM|nr:hypothetical protein [Corallincola luteus]TCI01321.1 hypothetical protein EZV61_18185 [Corallincola luteus]
MDDIDLKEIDINNTAQTLTAIAEIQSCQREVLLTENGEVVGAILTKDQYNWFLDQLDESEEVSVIADRANDADDAISLEEFKKQLGED